MLSDSENGGKQGAIFLLRSHCLGNIHVSHLNPEITHCYNKLCSEIFSSTNLKVSENVRVVLEVCMAARRLSVISVLSKLQDIPNSSYIICTWQESLSFQYITAKRSDIKHAPCWAVRLARCCSSLPAAFHGLPSVLSGAFILYIHLLMQRQVVSNVCQKQNFRGMKLMNLSGIQLISSVRQFERISSWNMETMHTAPLKIKHFISEMQYSLHWYLEKKKQTKRKPFENTVFIYKSAFTQRERI